MPAMQVGASLRVVNTHAPLLTVFAREWCGLCDDMIAGLLPLGEQVGFEVDIVLIDDDDELQARYGTLVPVLEHAGVRICHHFLDLDAVRAHLAHIGLEDA